MTTLKKGNAFAHAKAAGKKITFAKKKASARKRTVKKPIAKPRKVVRKAAPKIVLQVRQSESAAWKTIGGVSGTAAGMKVFAQAYADSHQCQARLWKK